MSTISTLTKLQQLRPGDHLKYHGVQWDVKDYSTYDDSYGYETAEWLLRSRHGTEYYLLREVDPQNPETLVNWYLAEEVQEPKIFQPDSQENIVPGLWQDMQEQREPYPELQSLGRVYFFESQTWGSYEGEERNTRITWDYWDRMHHWNLALEAWPNRELNVYLTKMVKPEDFYDIEIGAVKQKSGLGKFLAANYQVLLAFSMLCVGILMMIFG